MTWYGIVCMVECVHVCRCLDSQTLQRHSRGGYWRVCIRIIHFSSFAWMLSFYFHLFAFLSFYSHIHEITCIPVRRDSIHTDTQAHSHFTASRTKCLWEPCVCVCVCILMRWMYVHCPFPITESAGGEVSGRKGRKMKRGERRDSRERSSEQEGN